MSDIFRDHERVLVCCCCAETEWHKFIMNAEATTAVLTVTVG